MFTFVVELTVLAVIGKLLKEQLISYSSRLKFQTCIDDTLLVSYIIENVNRFDDIYIVSFSVVNKRR